jgi:hypothetical protein
MGRRARGARSISRTATAFASGVALAAALLGAWWAGAPAARAAAAPETHTIVGYLSLQEASGYLVGPCHGSGGFADIDRGTPVTVRDDVGEVIGAGRFGAGKPTGARLEGASGPRAACVFKFVVKDVPTSATYTFVVSTRGGLTYSYAELARSKWKLGAVLGDRAVVGDGGIQQIDVTGASARHGQLGAARAD